MTKASGTHPGRRRSCTRPHCAGVGDQGERTAADLSEYADGKFMSSGAGIGNFVIIRNSSRPHSGRRSRGRKQASKSPWSTEPKPKAPGQPLLADRRRRISRIPRTRRRGQVLPATPNAPVRGSWLDPATTATEVQSSPRKRGCLSICQAAEQDSIRCRWRLVSSAYFPKGTDLSRWTKRDLAAVAHTLNTRPRKTLGGRTPAESMNHHLQLLEHRSVATTS